MHETEGSTTPSPSAVSADLLNERALRCPHTFNQWLHRQAPVFRDADTGFFVVTRYDDIRHVLTQPKLFSSAATIEVMRASLSPEKQARQQALFNSEGWVPTPTLSLMDNPRHAEIRALFTNAFRQARIRQIEPQAKSLATDLVNQMANEGIVDMVAAFCAPFPLAVICSQLGVAEEDIPRVKAWTDAWTRRFSMGLSEQEEEACIREEIAFQHHFRDIVACRREQPDETVLSDLINMRLSDGSELSYAEIVSHLLSDLLVGGAETSTNALAEGILQWCRQPSLMTQLRLGDDSAMNHFVEEVLRLASPVQGLFRVATQKTVIADIEIPEGALIHVRFGAANRDASKFIDPDLLSMDRANAGSHLAFGSGIHHCVGAPLARLELRIGFSALLNRCESLSLVIEEDALCYLPSLNLRALTQLPVHITSRQ